MVSVLRGFLFLWVLGMGYVISLWHSLSLPYIIFNVYCGMHPGRCFYLKIRDSHTLIHQIQHPPFGVSQSSTDFLLSVVSKRHHFVPSFSGYKIYFYTRCRHQACGSYLMRIVVQYGAFNIIILFTRHGYMHWLLNKGIGPWLYQYTIQVLY